MYVDNLDLSCDSIEEGNKLVQESKRLYEKSGFNVTGFASNCSTGRATLEDARRFVGTKYGLTLIPTAGSQRGGSGHQEDSSEPGCNNHRFAQVLDTIYHSGEDVAPVAVARRNLIG
ncbi:hypothetical protein T07_1978 [Trichinella nelsoni]|uniref:Uncharacterized protein n=1 Tax=Trichinella nelsoni TaxID=6336 RepID=A0A0V0RN99_9BILA|nr:hypothetical protein T07_1978 [Trichinella nelsoni]